MPEVEGLTRWVCQFSRSNAHRPMKPIAFALLTALCTGVYVEECRQPTSQMNGAVAVAPDADPASGMYHVNVHSYALESFGV